MTKILLASKSPRRKQLISTLGWPVEIVEIDVDETLSHPVAASETAQVLALRKSQGYDRSKLEEGTILVTADTVVVHNDHVMGKPCDKDEAVRMLRELSGAKHQVYTGVCAATKNKEIAFTEKTEVHFKQLTNEEIEYYIENYRPFDKAGSYGIQEWIGMIGITKIDGCYYNVMGLPTARLYSAIKDLMTE